MKLIPVTGLDNRKWMMTSSCVWFTDHNQIFDMLVCKIHTWWPIPLVDPEIWARSVKYRPVCRIHVAHDMAMKPIVTFSFCQNLLLDKVSWLLDKNWLLNSTFGFAQLYSRILDHLLVTPWKGIWKFFYVKRCVIESY